jgi:uncharacterized protein YlxW (UPF0749 family)
MIKNLTDKRQKLSLEMSDLSDRLYDQRNSFENETLFLQSLEQEIGKLEIVNGNRAVEGEGLEISFLASSLLQYGDLISLINELWASGAEAIEVDGQRINANTIIFYQEGADGLEIAVNGRVVHWPLKISAVGNANNLEKGLTLPGGLMDIFAYNKIYPTIRQKSLITLPAAQFPSMYAYAKEYTEPPVTEINATPPPTSPLNTPAQLP